VPCSSAFQALAAQYHGNLGNFQFNGIRGHTIGFYKIVTDNTGLHEGPKTVTEAVTQIEFILDDIIADSIVDMSDAVLVLQCMSGMETSTQVYQEYARNGDNRIGL
jgi:hypothetical protein